MSALDIDVPLSLGHFVSTTTDLLVIIVLIAFVTQPILIVFLAIMDAIYAQVNSISFCYNCLNYLCSMCWVFQNTYN
jgi:hypothetical protein